MGLTAKKVYAILNGKIKKISGDVSSLGTPLFYAGSVLTADLLPLSPDAGAVYNIEQASIYGAAGTNVAWNGVIWDALGPTVDLSLLLTKEQASELYLTKNQGVENSGKVAGIDSSGNIVPMFPQGFEYDDNTKHLRFGYDPQMVLGAEVQLDNTLTKSGYAADAKVTGDELKKKATQKEASAIKEDLIEIFERTFDKDETWGDYIKIKDAYASDGRINVGQNGDAFRDGTIMNNGTDAIYEYRKFSVNSNKRVMFSYSTVQNKVANYAFYDSSDNLVAIYPTGAIGGESSVTNVYVDTPKNSAYMIICTRKSQIANLHIYISEKNEQITFNNNTTQKTADSKTDNQSDSIENVHTVLAEGKRNVVSVVNRVKYPRDVVFGGEYLEHWYEKIYDGTQNVVVDIEGDSISQGYTGSNVFLGMRDHAVKRIMKSGNYDLSKVEIFNNAIGGCSTNEWVGRTEYFKESFQTEEYYEKYRNGMLAYGMKHNPDLMIVGFGMNDAKIEVDNLSLKERLDLYERNFHEALDRIRGNVSINGRPAYNKSVDELSIIITNVTNTTADEHRYYENWQIYIRDLLANICREYKCAYADFTKLTYGYTDSSFTSWRQINTSGNKVGLHPNKYQVAYWMSSLADLIYPVCMHNIEV